MINYIIGIAAVALAAFLIGRMIINAKKGSGGCGCGCSGCSSCPSAHRDGERP